VRDSGAGAAPEALRTGTGLARLRDRLAALYPERAGLDVSTTPGEGCLATLTLPAGGDA